MIRDINQTHFAAQEPLLENAALPPQPEPEIDERTLTHDKHRRRLLLGLGVGVVIFIVSLIALVMSLPRRQTGPNASPSPTPVMNQTQAVNEFHQQVLDLKTELDAADPSRDFLPPPPVDIELRLEEKRR